MPKFRVPLKQVVTEIWEVEAKTAEEAMQLVLDCDEEHSKLVDELDGDPEVYYPDIREIKENE